MLARRSLLALGALLPVRALAQAPLMVETRTLEELYQAARAEGGNLLVYGGGDLPNGSAGTERAFNQRFPGMKLRILVDRSKYHAVRIDNQMARGKVACDVAHILTIDRFDQWKAEGRLLAYKPLGWDHVYADFRDPDGAYTAITVFAFSTVYNTAQVTEADAPRDAPDFLHSRFKGRIVLGYPQDDDALLYQFDRIVSVHGWQYIERLLTQDVHWVRGSAPARVMVQKGEKAVTFAASGPLVAPADAPSRFILPTNDSFLSWPQPAAIFRDARHPAAAKLYMSWLLSRDVQGAPGRQWPVRADVPAAGGFKPVFEYNTQPGQFRAFLSDRARLERVRDQLEQYIGPMQGPNPTKVEGLYPQ